MLNAALHLLMAFGLDAFGHREVDLGPGGEGFARLLTGCDHTAPFHLATEHVLDLARLQSAFRRAFLAPFTFDPCTFGTTHMGVLTTGITGVGTVTEAVALSFPGLVSSALLETVAVLENVPGAPTP